MYSRGVAICSKRDAMHKQVGRGIAFGRANRAMLAGKTLDESIIDYEHLRDKVSFDTYRLLSHDLKTSFKSSYCGADLAYLSTREFSMIVKTLA
jgi:hypothetical protein